MPDRGATDRQRLGIARATRKENVRVEGSGRSRTQEARTGLPEPKRARQSGWCGVNRMAHRRDERRLAARDAGARLENRISVGCRRRPSVSLGRVSPPAFPGRKTWSQPGEVIRTSLCGSLRTIDVGSRVEARAKGARERSAPHQCWVALRAHLCTRAQVRRQASRGESHSALNQRGQDSSLVSMVNLGTCTKVGRKLRLRPARARGSYRPGFERFEGSREAVVPSGRERDVRSRSLKVNAPPARACTRMKPGTLLRKRRTGAGGQHQRAPERAFDQTTMRHHDDLPKLAARIAAPPHPCLPARNGRGRESRSPHRGEQA
jgi:hypothetical protein